MLVPILVRKTLGDGRGEVGVVVSGRKAEKLDGMPAPPKGAHLAGLEPLNGYLHTGLGGAAKEPKGVCEGGDAGAVDEEDLVVFVDCSSAERVDMGADSADMELMLTHACAHARTYKNARVHTHTRTHTERERESIHTQTQTHQHMLVHTHPPTHTHMHTHTHTQTQNHVRLLHNPLAAENT